MSKLLREWPGLLTEDKISHDSELFAYIQERNAALWAFVNALLPGSGGQLKHFVDIALDKAKKLEAENSELKRLLDEAKQELADVLTRPENADQANGRLIMALDEFRAFYQRKLSEAGIAPND